METLKPRGHRQQEEQKKRKVPSAEELISHYESRGLDQRAAAVKVVRDLQSAVVRLAAASKRDRRLSDRIAAVDAKLDSKPGYPDAFAIGLASGLAAKGLASLLPHLASAAAHAWNSAASVFNQ